MVGANGLEPSTSRLGAVGTNNGIIGLKYVWFGNLIVDYFHEPCGLRFNRGLGNHLTVDLKVNQIGYP